MMIAQNDERITALMENTSFREDAKEAFIQQMEMGWEDLFMGRMALLTVNSEHTL